MWGQRNLFPYPHWLNYFWSIKPEVKLESVPREVDNFIEEIMPRIALLVEQSDHTMYDENGMNNEAVQSRVMKLGMAWIDTEIKNERTKNASVICSQVNNSNDPNDALKVTLIVETLEGVEVHFKLSGSQKPPESLLAIATKPEDEATS